MSARDDVLARARRALVDVGDDAVDLPVARPLTRVTGRDAMIETLVDRITDYRATVERVPATDAPAAIRRALGGGRPRILVPAGFPDELLPEGGADGVEAVADDPPVALAELDRCDGVLSTARLAIAETGTIVLDHAAGQGRRAATLVPDLHVCVLRADQVVPDVPRAVAALDPTRPQTWISGPSATSDIELDRVEGVHGPRTLRVVLIDG